MVSSPSGSTARALRSVGIVDDDDSVREAVAALLRRKGYTVQGFADGPSFLTAVEVGSVDCAILDFLMPGMSGIEIAAELHGRGLDLPIVFLSGETDIPATVSAIKLGATDFLTKPVSAERLVAAVDELLTHAECRRDLARRHRDAIETLDTLTRREREVMDGMLCGLQNKQIARILGISHRTVEIHRARVMQKTQTANLLALARLAGLEAG